MYIREDAREDARDVYLGCMFAHPLSCTPGVFDLLRYFGLSGLLKDFNVLERIRDAH